MCEFGNVLGLQISFKGFLVGSAVVVNCMGQHWNEFHLEASLLVFIYCHVSFPWRVNNSIFLSSEYIKLGACKAKSSSRNDQIPLFTVIKITYCIIPFFNLLKILEPVIFHTYHSIEAVCNVKKILEKLKKLFFLINFFVTFFLKISQNLTKRKFSPPRHIFPNALEFFQ